MSTSILRVLVFVLLFGGSGAAFAAAPTATTSAATNITTSSAMLNGIGNPNGSPTTGWFRYSTTNPGTCNNSFGARVPSAGGTDLGMGSSAVRYSITTTGLSPGNTYYFCAIVSNSAGTAYGEVLSFTIPAPPTVVTSTASSITSSSATLQGSAVPFASSTTGWFRYATSNPGTCNSTFGTSSSGVSLGSGTTSAPFSVSISGLAPATTYYFCATASNSYGTGYGSVLSFSTPPAAPQVSTTSATSVVGTSAVLNGSANPGGASTTAWFRYASSSPGSCNDTFGTRAPSSGGASLGSGSSTVAFNQSVSGLAPATTYYFCAIAASSAGTAFGSLSSFTTPSPPTVTTLAASNISGTSATLNGSANPNRAAATGWFRYATTNPGTCNDSFGSRAPLSGGSSLGSGSSSTGFYQSISGLSTATTYYFCAIASSSEGTAFGAVLSFTTATAPAVTTGVASSIAPSSATLGGSANPNGASSTAWFRYGTTNPGTCSDSFGSLAGGVSIGAGSISVPYTQSVGGLSPNTTYYFCAVANNSYGTAYGAVVSFSTPAALPSVSTTNATMITGTGAVLNGSANPGGASTTGWFRYATTSPGTCNDSFGTRAPSSGGASLGSGASTVAFNQSISGLSPNTTYYFCAIAANSTGTGVGSVYSFITPSPPTVTTTAASNISGTSATLNGSANPNRAAATGWFRYATTNPGTCNDSFGSRAPLSGGTSLGSGTSSTGFYQSISGLSTATTYYFCAIASSSEGTAFGAVLSFTTATAPSVTTGVASSIAPSSATLGGSANPNGASSTAWFRYGTTNPGTCSDSFGTSAGGVSVGAGNVSVPYTQSVGGLSPNTTYYFCAVANNSYGTTYGAVVSFSTPAAKPIVTTNLPTMITGTGALLNGSANPGGASATGWFRYATTSPGTCNDTFGTRAPSTGGSSLGSGASAVVFSQSISGLSPNTTYYVCAIAANSSGTGVGAVYSFITPSPPTVSTAAAANVSGTSATLNGSANPNRATTTGWFRYATTNPGTCNDSFGSRAPLSGGTSLGSGTSSTSFYQSISGLSTATTYYFCAIASSSEGTAFGAVLSFTTATAPSVTTGVASSIAPSSATLSGSVNPNGASTTAWFRYGTTNPGTCSDSFGSLVGGSSMGAGSVAAPYTQSVGGLAPNTTYYFCAVANNSYGTTYGAVVSFSTPAAKPTVSTGSPTLITGRSAQLNGSANPGGASATGWFRYATTSPGSCNDMFGTRAPSSGGASLGSGAASVSFSQSLTGLSPNTTYYFCAIAANSAGTGTGGVYSFTTPAAPSVTTTSASSIASTGATLNGGANPNGAATTGWFRFATTSPGTCNDTFGTRAPASGGTALGSGSGVTSYYQSVSGLSPATTYYFCAIAANSEGTSFGAVLSFSTPTVPKVTTGSATSVTANAATLSGTANPGGASSTGWFRYSTTNPGTCSNGFGFFAGYSSLGSGLADVPFSQAISGLAPGTTYYYCALASNASGSGVGAVLSFTTAAGAPYVSTDGAGSLTTSTATINGSATPNGAATTAWFRYGTTNPGICSDSFGTRAPSSGGSSLGSGITSVAFSQTLSGLSPGTTYYYCAVAANSLGTVVGSVRSFTTQALPTVNTLAATPVTATTATLNASANPNGFSSTGWFRYATSSPGSCNDSFGTRTPSSGGVSLGSVTYPVGYSQSISGLAPATTYYVCAIASSTVGTAFGSVLSFTTPISGTIAPPQPESPAASADSPTATTPTERSAALAVSTRAASAITTGSAVLSGSVNPQGQKAMGWFRYSAVDPGRCDDRFGTRAPAGHSADLGDGDRPVTFGQAITDLERGVTYSFCAIVATPQGLAFGPVQHFVVEADRQQVNPPTATEGPASRATSAAAPAASANATDAAERPTATPATPDVAPVAAQGAAHDAAPGAAQDIPAIGCAYIAGAPQAAGLPMLLVLLPLLGILLLRRRRSA